VFVVLVRGDTPVVSWPLRHPEVPDLATIDDLARVQLTARRLGWSMCVYDAGTELSQLLAFVGLDDVLTVVRSGEVFGKTEGGEEVGVEEVVPRDDPSA
jgi:hypothetical protein